MISARARRSAARRARVDEDTWCAARDDRMGRDIAAGGVGGGRGCDERRLRIDGGTTATPTTAIVCSAVPPPPPHSQSRTTLPFTLSSLTESVPDLSTSMSLKVCARRANAPTRVPSSVVDHFSRHSRHAEAREIRGCDTRQRRRRSTHARLRRARSHNVTHAAHHRSNSAPLRAACDLSWHNTRQAPSLELTPPYAACDLLR